MLRTEFHLRKLGRAWKTEKIWDFLYSYGWILQVWSQIV